MFKKHALALTLASLMGVTTAYAATLSAPTEKVVGFKPLYQNATGAGSVSGELKPGATLTVDVTKLNFFDQDGDAHDITAVKYSWVVEGIGEISTSSSATLPTGTEVVGKNITLSVTPVTVTGDPLEGKALVLTDLNIAGAGGGDGNGNVDPDPDAAPIVTNLQMAGSLLQGNQLTATYLFDSNGGEPTDKSTYAWGIEGSTAANVGTTSIVTSGVVPAYTITTGDAGSVMEVSVQAANAAAKTGNTLTVDSTTGGATDGGGNGEVPYIKADPVAVEIKFDSSATDDANGIDGQRPVAAVDVMSAVITPAAGASPNVADYTFQWKADNVDVTAADVGADKFTPAANQQGLAITVEVAPAP